MFYLRQDILFKIYFRRKRYISLSVATNLPTVLTVWSVVCLYAKILLPKVEERMTHCCESIHIDIPSNVSLKI